MAYFSRSVICGVTFTVAMSYISAGSAHISESITRIAYINIARIADGNLVSVSLSNRAINVVANDDISIREFVINRGRCAPYFLYASGGQAYFKAAPEVLPAPLELGESWNFYALQETKPTILWGDAKWCGASIREITVSTNKGSFAFSFRD